nr:ATP-binding protein [Paenibacillus terricola]
MVVKSPISSVVNSPSCCRHTPYLEFLDKLLAEELLAKHDRFIQPRTRLAHLPFRKTLDQFDFDFQPSVDERRIRDLSTLRGASRKSHLPWSAWCGQDAPRRSAWPRAIKKRHTVYFIRRMTWCRRCSLLT